MADHSQLDTTPLIEVLDGDPSADPDIDGPLAHLPGVVGVRDTRDLADIAGRVIVIGRASHTGFGDHIAAFGERLLNLANEARRRLVADRLPLDGDE